MPTCSPTTSTVPSTISVVELLSSQYGTTNMIAATANNSTVFKFLYSKQAITYLLTPWCTVLLEQLTGLQLFKKFPAFHGTRRFITALTSVRHLSLSWASPIWSIYPHPTSCRSILILSTHLCLDLPSSGYTASNGSTANTKLITKDVANAYVEEILKNLPKQTDKNHEIPGRIASLWTEA